MDVCKTEQKPREWYSMSEFPLLPEISYREGDKWNTSSYSFHWLFIRLWSLDSFDFELSVGIDAHWGIHVCGILPYTRWVIGIPLPYSVQKFVYNKLWRKPKNEE